MFVSEAEQLSLGTITLQACKSKNGERRQWTLESCKQLLVKSQYSLCLYKSSSYKMYLDHHILLHQHNLKTLFPCNFHEEQWIASCHDKFCCSVFKCLCHVFLKWGYAYPKLTLNNCKGVLKRLKCMVLILRMNMCKKNSSLKKVW